MLRLVCRRCEKVLYADEVAGATSVRCPHCRSVERLPIQSASDSGANLIRCGDCGKPVSKKAKACPSCGCPVPPQMGSLSGSDITGCAELAGCLGCLGMIVLGVLLPLGVVAGVRLL